MGFNNENLTPPSAKIKVIGIGGGGGNAVNTMIRSNIEGVDFITANTDIQSLRFSLASAKIQIGTDLTKGLGAGADPDIGRDAALEDRATIQESLEGSNMVFVTAGMGGGTGTGGASIVAQIARDIGALTVGVVTKPFAFEGKRRQRIAEIGISRLKEHVDTLITIPNQRLLQVASPDLSMMDAFKMADNVLVNAVRGISNIINVPGVINVDFADVKTIMSSTGLALMGIGTAEGPNRAVEAAHQAISSPLLEDVDIEGATGILINITAGPGISLYEVDQACCVVQEAAHEDANIIFGAVIDETMGDQVRVTVIATGFPSEELDSPEILSSMNSRPRYGNTMSKGPTAGSYSSEYGSVATRKDPNGSRHSGPSNFEYSRRDSSSYRRECETERPRNGHGPAIPQNSSMTQNMQIERQAEQRGRPAVHQEFDPGELMQLTLGKSNVPRQEESPTSSVEHQVPSEFVERNSDFIPLDSAAEHLEQPRVVGAQADRCQHTGVVQASGVHRPSDPGIPTPYTAEAAGNQDSDNENNWQSNDIFLDANDGIPDMDAKIDAALEMVDRINTAQGASDADKDTLDIPAFLRNGMKDLSLS